MNIKFDLIIANPPYGSPGANITKNIIDNVYFEEYVNLLPVNDYKRNDSKDLFRYAREMESINNGFKDAVVTTHLCKIAKEPNNITLDQFEISNYIDRSLDKYFTENVSREHYAFDNPECGKHPDTWNINSTFMIGFRDMNHGHLPYSKESATYKWNVNKSIDYKYLVANYNNPRADRKGTYEISFYGIMFNTTVEKDNFVRLIYSKDGFRFISKVFTAMNVDSYTTINKFMPKVDWTRSWTVEEILEDYGYTELEIKDIMKDLKNFRGQDLWE